MTKEKSNCRHFFKIVGGEGTYVLVCKLVLGCPCRSFSLIIRLFLHILSWNMSFEVLLLVVLGGRSTAFYQVHASPSCAICSTSYEVSSTTRYSNVKTRKSPWITDRQSTQSSNELFTRTTRKLKNAHSTVWGAGSGTNRQASCAPSHVGHCVCYTHIYAFFPVLRKVPQQKYQR